LTGLADAVFSFLLDPRVRRARRWSSLVTVPLAIVVLAFVGVEGGAAAAAVELVLVLVVLALVLRLDRERREAVLDLVVPPVERRLVRSELAILATFVRALSRRRHPRRLEWSYHRGSPELALALALLPAIVGELAVFHLFVPWFWVRVGAVAVSAYAVIWLVGWALGLRVYPHRLSDDVLELRLGALYRAAVPLNAIDAIERRRERVERGTRFVLRSGKAYLAADGRVDLHLSLRAPAVVTRPLAGPASVHAVAVAADNPAAMAGEIEARLEARAPRA
jgi:hypothetical protein